MKRTSLILVILLLAEIARAGSPPINVAVTPRLAMIIASKDLRIEVRIEGANARHFLAQPTQMSVYVGEKRVVTRAKPASPLVLSIPAEHLTPGEHRIAVNWGSDYGPAAATAFRLQVRRGVSR